MDLEIKRRLRTAAASLVATVFLGTAGYTLIEGWPWFDSLYMTVITLATIGYGEVHPLSNAGRIFTIFLITIGLSTAAYSFSALTAFFIEGQLTDILRRKKMASKIASLTDHYIICGSGNTGWTILKELANIQRPFVVIENDAEKAARLQAHGFLALQGDALEDATLLEAGISRAAGLFCALANDRDNVFAAITARGLNPKLRIVSELHDEMVHAKLVRSGADSAVSSAFIGGLRMVSEMVRPAAVGFLDSMIRDKTSVYRFEEVRVPDGSSLVGRPAGEVKGAQGGAALLVAIRQPGDGRYEINPPAQRALRAGDVLVVLGSSDEVRALKGRVDD